MKETFDKIKKVAYSILQGSLRKSAKYFYYDMVIWPMYYLKNKIYYGQSDFFEAVEVETTTYCNLRCKFCPNSKYERGLLKNKKLLNEKLFRKIIDELAEINYRGKIFPYHYGEPLTDNRLSELISYAKKKLPKAKIKLNSNGLLLTVPIYKKLVESGMDSLVISQYTGKMLPNVKEVLDYLKIRPKKENKILYRVFTEETANSNRGGEIKIKKVWDKPHCTYPEKNMATIDYNGDITLCCNDYHSSIKLGNIKNEKLIDIWNKPNYKKLRKEIRKGIFKLPICKRCVGQE